MDEENIKYLSKYIEVTDEIKAKIEKHASRYGIKPEICAWYADWDDFCSDWCDSVGYSKTEARAILHGGIGEFMKLPYDNGIVRFAL